MGETMINVTKMKKILNANKVIWENEGEYMIVTDGYRIYKDRTENFNPKIKAALLEKFGTVPAVGEAYKLEAKCKLIKNSEDVISKCDPFATILINAIGLLDKDVKRTKIIAESVEIFRAEKGLTGFNKEYSQVFKNPEKATIKSNGEVDSAAKFTFEGETMEYYLLPIKFKDGLEERLKEMLGF